MWFWHVLALHLGCTVAELRRRMSRREFRHWWQFHLQNPIDPVGQHIRPAALAAYYSARYSMGGTRESFDDVMSHVVVPRPDAEAWALFDSFVNP